MLGVNRNKENEELAFQRWWDEDFSWSGLRRKVFRGGDRITTLQDYWSAEKEELIEFGGRRWTKYHLPLFDPKGERSDKSRWHVAQREAFNAAMVERLEKGVVEYKSANGAPEIDRPRTPCWGIVFPAGFHSQLKEVCADFRFARFEGAVTWNATDFLGRQNFADVSFLKYVSFEDARFNGAALFHRAAFSNHVVFERATFLGEAQFGEVTFRGDASFLNTKFRQAAYFSTVEFGDRAMFESASFMSNVSFRNAMFGGDVNFRSATFGDVVTFAASVGSLFPDIVDFSNARFRAAAIFSGREFRRQTLFAGARFEAAPHFQGAKLHADTSFSGAQFSCKRGEPEPASWRGAMRVVKGAALRSRLAARFRAAVFGLRKSLPRPVRRWPFDQWLPGFSAVRASRNQSTEELESAYRALRRLTGENGNHEHEGMFYELEMNARRNRTDVPLFERTLACLFSWSSGYGQDTLRPIVWWLLLVTLAASGTCQVLLDNLPSASMPTVDEVIRFVVRQFIPPPTVWSEREVVYLAEKYFWIEWLRKNYSLTLEMIGTACTLLTISLLAVFFITLRRRFALK